MNKRSSTAAAIILWLIVGGLAGAVMAELLLTAFAPTGRQLLFSSIAGMGLVALLMIFWPRRRRNITSPAVSTNRPALPAPTPPTLLAAQNEQSVIKPSATATDPKVAAREWLDDFLVRQQQKE